MEYTILALLIVSGLLMFHEMSSLKKQIKCQEERIHQLAKLTGHESVSAYWVSDEIKELATQLKQTGNEVEAVKKIRENTQMSLLEAKRYVDDLT